MNNDKIENLFLVTSVINISNNPFSYTNTRSVFTREERFEQTKYTLQSIKDKITNVKIMLIECSDLNEEETKYLKQNVDFFVNLYDTKDQEIIDKINSNSKSLGESQQTICGFKYLFENNIMFERVFKISGRYYLNDMFNYELFKNDFLNARFDGINTTTCLYKLTYPTSQEWYNFLLNSTEDFINCIQYEYIFSNFLNKMVAENKYIVFDTKPLGVSGLCAVDGCLCEHV